MALGLVSRNVEKWETGSDHPEINFIFSIPLLSLSEFDFKEGKLCSLLDLKEQRMKGAFILYFLMHGNS